MTISTKLTQISFSLVIILSVSMLALADTIRLKDGSMIKGTIVSFTGGKFTVMIGSGSRSRQMTFSASEVESIKFDSPGDRPQFTASTRQSNDNSAIIKTGTTTPPKEIVTNNRQPVTQPVRTSNSNSTSNSKPTPIGWNVRVLADNTANGWTNSGWVLKKGQRIRITGGGNVSLGKGKTSSASGDPELEDNNKLLKNVPTGALVAVIGEDNNDFIYVGASREFTATRDGALFLGINEGYLEDNTGAYDVKVEILPDDSN